MLAKKWVSVHSPFCLPASKPEVLLSSDSSYSSDTSGDEVPLVGEDTDDEHKTSTLASRTCHDILLQSKRVEARRGHQYSSPPAQAHAGQMAGVPSLASKTHVIPRLFFLQQLLDRQG
jgi:hypothetical protein